MKLWNGKQQPHEHSFSFIIVIAPGSIIILFFLFSRVWGIPIFLWSCYSHPSAISIKWSPVTLKLIYKALVSWKGHRVNIGNIKVIWQLESYNSVLNYLLFFAVCFITKVYTQLSNNATAATIAQSEKHLKIVRAPNWTRNALTKLLYILLQNQNGSLWLSNLLGFLFPLSANDDATYL